LLSVAAAGILDHDHGRLVAFSQRVIGLAVDQLGLRDNAPPPA